MLPNQIVISIIALFSSNKLNIDNFSQNLQFFKQLLDSPFIKLEDSYLKKFLPKDKELEYASFIMDFMAHENLLDPIKQPSKNVY